MKQQAFNNSSEDRPGAIRRLSETVVNRIAAGEVIERPASVVKELMENAIDAGATRIEVTTANGGKTLMRVIDNGHGMNRDNIALAIERHCTSKLGDDLMDIRNLGFRGEALPSIGSVARLTITSRSPEESSGWKVSVSGGRTEGPVPAALTQGSVLEVSDLFFATPARLKFLKTDQAEANAITDVFKRIALAFPQIRFSISGSDRSNLDYVATDQVGRIEQVLGKAFGQNSVRVDAVREDVHLTGLASVPTWHRGNALAQYFFVNNRPVKDKALLGAVRGAYMDFVPSGRHPTVALFLDLDPRLVDVNVHPAKAEVRFRDPGLVRGLIVGALKQVLSEQGPLTSRSDTQSMMQAFRREFTDSPSRVVSASLEGWQRPLESRSERVSGLEETQSAFEHDPQPSGHVIPPEIDAADLDFPLGSARAQVHKNYIIAQSRKGLVIVDQHAAHERIVYEKLKSGLAKKLPSQLLLVPEVVDLPEEDVNRLASYAEDFEWLGLELEPFGPGAVAVRGTPAMLGETNVRQLVLDLADEISEWDSTDGLRERLEYVAATMACHGSVRSGRILKADEMNALLRQMEETPNAGQCNHGRPTYIELDLKDIERLFGRS